MTSMDFINANVLLTFYIFLQHAVIFVDIIKILKEKKKIEVFKNRITRII